MDDMEPVVVTEGSDEFFTPKYWTDTFAPILADAALRLAYAVLVFIVGYIVVKILLWIIRKFLNRVKGGALSPELVNFVMSVIKFILYVVLIVAVVDVVGLELLQLSAILAALALAMGFAVGGMMTNFIAGFLIMVNKPYIVGEYIEANGSAGTVKAIEIFHTHLLTPDNKLIICPNGPLATGVLINYSRNEKRRVDLVIGVSYDADLGETRLVLEKVVKGHENVLEEPATVINVHEHGDNSVNFVVRPWVEKANYWGVYWDLHEQIKIALDEANIGIPYPQRDVHIVSGGGGDAAFSAAPKKEKKPDLEIEKISKPAKKDKKEKKEKKRKSVVEL